MYGGIAETEMGTYPTCVRRVHGAFPEGQLPPRAPRPLIGRGRTEGSPRPMGLGLEEPWDENHLSFTLYIHEEVELEEARDGCLHVIRVPLLPGRVRFICWLTFRGAHIMYTLYFS